MIVVDGLRSCLALGVKIFMLSLSLHGSAFASSGGRCFSVDEESLRIARELKVVWADVQYAGAPVVDMRQPLGSGTLREQVASVGNRQISSRQAERTLDRALSSWQILLRFGHLPVGVYSIDRGDGVARVFEMKPEHRSLQLLFSFKDDRAGHDFGVHSARPYGPNRCWMIDLADELGETYNEEAELCDESFSESQRERYQALHQSSLDLVVALQQHGTLAERTFSSDPAVIGLWSQCTQ